MSSSMPPPPLPPKQQSFFKRNIVAVVMIPSIVAIHYGWSVLQKNRSLVTAEEEIDIPVVTFAKHFWNKVLGLGTTDTNKISTTPAVTAAAAAPAIK